MIFGCRGNINKPDFFNIVSSLNQYFMNTEHKFILSDDIIDSENHSELQSIPRKHIEELAQDCDIIISIGGDGTILSTLRMIKNAKASVFGIHIGGLGFLAECTQENYIEGLNLIIEGNYSVKPRMLLKAEINNGNLQTYYALNDIVIGQGRSPRILKTHINVSDEYLNTYESDGIIFYTPTGSTAYSLSAGGPIVTPYLDLIGVTPICPHSLSARPIMLSSNEVISIGFAEEPTGMTITIDGQVHIPIDYTTEVTIKKAEYSAKMIRLPLKKYFETLRTKMGWAGNVR
jgi:NAD+ kinase